MHPLNFLRFPPFGSPRPRAIRPAAGIALALLLALVPATRARAAEKLAGPLLDGMGEHRHPVTTSSAKAQRYFDQGLTLCFAFNHKEAVRSFQSAAALDPGCAMAYWGIAYASGPHVNRAMDQTDNRRAWTALQQALARTQNLSPREQAYIQALSARYTEQLPADRSQLDRNYAAAMRDVTRQFPDDLDAAALFAEAMMDTMPWDYWTRDRSPKPETREILEALERVMTRNPDHPGANHLYIHAVEAGPNPEHALPAADRLRMFAPGAGHLVHMPSHIDVRIGQYPEAILANERAVRADQAYIRACRAQGFYPGVYYPHNIHFLWWAQLFDGRSADALKTAHRAADYALDNYCGPNKVLEAPRLRHLPWLTLARFGRWDEILRIPQPAMTNDFLVDRALWHFARGIALASTRQADAAATELESFRTLTQSRAAAALDHPSFPVIATLAIAESWLAGKVALAQQRPDAALDALKKAVAAEDAMPYMEPSFWPFPVRPTLGAALLKAGHAAEAEVVFREDLRRWPRNGWSLLGLKTSLTQQGRSADATLVQREFDRAWSRSDVPLSLDWF